MPEYLGIDLNLEEIEQYKQSRKKLIEEGYDGIVYGLEYDGEGIDYGFVVFDENNIKVENIKNYKEAVDKYRPFNFNKTLTGDTYKGNYDLTPQQKQQAQQLYSQYLDTVFPDSKVEEIDNNLYISVLNDLKSQKIIDKQCS